MNLSAAQRDAIRERLRHPYSVTPDTLFQDCTALLADLDHASQALDTVVQFAAEDGDARSGWTLGYRAARNDLRSALARHGISATSSATPAQHDRAPQDDPAGRDEAR